MRTNQWAGLAALSIGIATIAGALGAHALENIFTPDQLNSFETGVRYQVYQSIAILILAVQKQFQIPRWNFHLHFWGMLIFSFSIYALNADEYLGLHLGFLGPITPIGGLLMIVAWIGLGVTLFTKSNNSK